MEDLPARERAAELHVQYLLKSTEEPVVSLLQAFEEYRQLSQACIFAAGFEHAGTTRKEAALWQAHTEGNKYFRRALSGMRKQANEQPVAVRQLIKFYLQFLKESQRFYREYIFKLSTTFGGIPELEAVAQQVKIDGEGESSQSSTTPQLRKKILDSCHQTLIYLGDLSRYRASEKLDKNPDFGPAIGYYGLACTLRPASGMGHHQQAVIALEQRQHLRAIYHLYRAMMVEEPHPNAANNLRLEFDKTNAAWDRGELIQKGKPNDPDSSKRTLVGWFVRLHSMCYKGEPFRGYEDLEREVVGQLAAEIKQRSLDATLMRMIMINLAAQFDSGEKFQEQQTDRASYAFMHFFRFNIKTFTTFLQVFYDELRNADLSMTNDNGEIDLAARLSETARRILPALRLYSSWLLPNTHLLEGLTTDELLKDAIDQLWTIYAKSVDLVAALFTIWDLEDMDEVSYLLEEDSDTLGFKPIMNAKTNKIWYNPSTGAVKPRFCDRGVERLTTDDEMMARVKDFLYDGLYLANDDDNAPIKLRGTRILLNGAEEPELPALPEFKKAQTTKVAKQPPQKPAAKATPLSYAAAAANGPSQTNTPTKLPNGNAANSQDAQLSRMVDDLVDEDEANNPVTPPQHHASHPSVVTKGDVSYSAFHGSTPDFAKLPDYSYNPKPIGTPASVSGPAAMGLRTPKNAGTATGKSMGMHSVSSIWNDASSSTFPAGLPQGTLGSPAQVISRGHSRVNSASSIRSRTSQGLNAGMGIADSWSSLESSAPRVNGLAVGWEGSNVASPLLFGAGGGVWSTGAHRNTSPPNGQGG